MEAVNLVRREEEEEIAKLEGYTLEESRLQGWYFNEARQSSMGTEDKYSNIHFLNYANRICDVCSRNESSYMKKEETEKIRHLHHSSHKLDLNYSLFGSFLQCLMCKFPKHKYVHGDRMPFLFMDSTVGSAMELLKGTLNRHVNIVQLDANNIKELKHAIFMETGGLKAPVDILVCLDWAPILYNMGVKSKNYDDTLQLIRNDLHKFSDDVIKGSEGFKSFNPTSSIAFTSSILSPKYVQWFDRPVEIHP